MSVRTDRGTFDIEVDDELHAALAELDRMIELFGPDADRTVIEKCRFADLVRGKASFTRFGRRSLSAMLRARVLARDQLRCRECGSEENLTIDHIIPFSKGGADTFENLRTLCGRCNSKKGARTE